MNFATAIRTCFCKYVTFSGRATRSEFWYWGLFVWILNILCAVADYAIFGLPSLDNPGAAPAATIAQGFSLLVALPSLAVGSRRLHDTGRSGWWQLLLITLIGIIPLLYWWVCKSQPDNKYGSDPLQAQ